MRNVYHVELSGGQAYTVTTDQHHDQLPAPTFKDHLLQVIRESVPGIVSGVVVGFVHKGHK